MTSGALLTLADLNRATLARQMLLARERMAVEPAVRRLAGMQAQVARPPFVGLWTRLESFRRTDLHRALQDRSVVRAPAMRATLHLMAAADYTPFREALRPLMERGTQWILTSRKQTVDQTALERAARAFFAKGPATFDAVRDHLSALYPGADERALGYFTRLSLPLVQVPTDAQWAFPAAASFALADEWIADRAPRSRSARGDARASGSASRAKTARTASSAKGPRATAPSGQDKTGQAPSGMDTSGPDALRELVRRYLAAFGPASVQDAQAWSGLPRLKDVFESLRPELVTFRDERKRELFDLPDAPRPGADVPAPVRFLPDFDNLVLAHDDRTRLIAPEHRSRIVTKNLLVRATFLVDGRVAGLWKVERRKATAILELEPFATLTKKTLSALETEGDALLKFVEEDAVAREVRAG